MILHRRFHAKGILTILGVLFCSSVLVAGGNEISGYARNQTSGRPASGDEVILIRLDQGMQEESYTKVDEQGSFKVPVQYPGKQYLVRVVHDGVSYDQQATTGGSVSISVFDATTQVRGVTGSIEILRTGTNGSLLHVSDMYEIWNQSNPPVTRNGTRTFEVYLPPHAKISSVLAASSDKLGGMISATAVPADPGHYTVSFPLRPGATKFAFNYDLPYEGRASFRTRHQYPMQQFAIMIPPTMKFSSRSSAFEVLATGNYRYQVRAINGLRAGEGPAFDLSGDGSLAPLRAQTRTPAAVILATPRPSPLVSLSSLPTTAPHANQTRGYFLSLILGALTIMLAVFSLFVWRSRNTGH
ncbi:MAG TPA: hypothetical protein VIH56_07420 [Candidatus Acidoferrales bacterium]